MSTFIGKTGFQWWLGVVEDRKDPIMLGRCRVRIFGHHTDNKSDTPTDDLPWAIPSMPLDQRVDGIGLKEGDWCWGFFMDGSAGQKPVVVGFIPGINKDAADPEKGFYDPTTELTPGAVPRPPEMSPTSESSQITTSEQKPVGRYENSDSLPGNNVAFGELKSEFDISKSKFDVNKDGKYDDSDAQKIVSDNTSSDGFFSGFSKSETSASIPMSRYPLENQLGEPSTSRLARNEKIEETIVEKKLNNLGSGEGAGHAAQDKNAEASSFPFMEPKTPYAAVYPYNHVYESESGHVIEVDDTPGAERLHWYHRSGTFREIHPDGTEVNKVTKAQYNFITDDFFLASGKSMNIDAKDAIRIKSGDDTNLAVGANLNAEVSSNLHLSTGESVYIYAKGGVIYIKGAKNVSIQAADDLDLISGQAIHLRAPQIHLDGTIHAPNPPYLPASAPVAENDADKKTEDSDTSSNSSKQGFLLPDGSPGEVFKPISDSNGKLVTLSFTPDPHELFEAIPTGTLEAVQIVYDHDNGTKTTWDVVRPVHVPGKPIDNPQMIEKFEDGARYLQRWSRPGGQYPKQLFWKTETGTKLIMDSSTRHMVKAPFNNKIPMS